MFSLIQEIGLKATARRELVPFVISFVTAEFFYKFHSFALECLAFIATWIALSCLQSLTFGNKGE